MRFALFAVLAFVLVLPTGSAAVTGSGTVTVGTSEGTYYVTQNNASASVWEESNGEPGLQKSCQEGTECETDRRLA